MTRRTARWLTFLYFFIAPGITAILVPWLLTDWEVQWTQRPLVAGVAGWLLAVLGFVPVIDAFARFARANGTPIPVAPPPRLVVDGFNAWLRNPMYLGVAASVAGQALLFGSAVLAAYCLAFWAVMASFVRFYEEPHLTETFGEEYVEYQRTVRAWVPRRPRRDGSAG
jgi:protein-S-isoprenylcysteine O-methyltransferase Ste14